MEVGTRNIVIAGAVGIIIGYLLFKPSIKIQSGGLMAQRKNKINVKGMKPNVKPTTTQPSAPSDEELSEFCGCGA
jgi:hypothetical protein